MTRPDSASWTAAKSAGDAAESSIGRWFRWRGFDVAKMVEPAAEYDLLVQARVEVKADLKAEGSGNVAVEVSLAGKPSGIMATTATLWVFVVGREALLLPALRLRDYVLGRNFPEVPAGDGHKARVRLVPLAELRKLPFVRVVQLIPPPPPVSRP